MASCPTASLPELDAYGLYPLGYRDLDHLGAGSGLDDAESAAALRARLGHLVQA